MTNKTTENNTGIQLRGHLIDIAHYPDGRTEIIQEKDNIVVDNGLIFTASLLGGMEGVPISEMAVGEGDPAWDVAPPPEDPETTALVSEIDRKAVTTQYWDVVLEQITVVPTNVLDIRVFFLSEEANGDLREFGLIAGGDVEEVLFNYVIHGKIVKTDSYNLERILRLTVERAAS